MERERVLFSVFFTLGALFCPDAHGILTFPLPSSLAIRRHSLFDADHSMKPSPLPPLADLPVSVYPPSSYPPPSYFESDSNPVHPALVVPARRTKEIQTTLDGLVFHEPKRKSVYAVEGGLDYTATDFEETKYDPSRERKLALVRLGGPPTPAEPGSCPDDIGGGHEMPLREANADEVWRDERLRSLLGSEAVDAVSTAPRGKASIRKSYIRLPSTLYDVLTVDQVLRRLMSTSDESNGKDRINNCNDQNINGDGNGNPVVKEIPSSFEIAGHIAHVNLNDEALPYKFLIGRAILDKNRPRIRLVVNKIGNIENEFRTFPMEILASVDKIDGSDFSVTVEGLCAGGAGGDSSTAVQVKIGPQHHSLMQVEVREHGCRFRLDFASVYFNSRLQGEHARLVDLITRDAKRRRFKRISAAGNADISNGGADEKEWTIVADAMAGVGPFAVPLTSPSVIEEATTKIVCHANDLNPISYEYLQTNSMLNKCAPNRIYMYNLDARRFIHKMNEDRVDVDHFIMNLPQLAPEFLDAFRGWKFHDSDDDELDPNASSSRSNDIPTKESEQRTRRRRMRQPMIHVHCFGEKPRSPDDVTRVERQVQQRCEDALGCPGCFDSSTTAAEISNGTIAVSYPTAKNNEFHVRVVRDVGPRKNMLCVSFRLPLEVERVEKLLISERGSIDISRNPVQEDEDAADCGTAGTATAGKGIDGKTKRGNDVVSDEIKLPHSKLMRT